MHRIYIPEPIGDAGLNELSAHCDVVAPWRKDRRLSSTEEAEVLRDCHAIVVRLFVVDDNVMESAPNLRVISKHGVGVDNIDLDAAERRNIPVLYAPGGNANAVAEHALALAFTLSRKTDVSQAAVVSESPWRREDYRGIEFSGKTLGIIGLGRIGRLVAQKCTAGLGMSAIAYDPYTDWESYDGPAERVQDLETLLRESDLVTLHVPLTSETKHMLGAAALTLMKSSAYLINTSRGGVVDEYALAAALRGDELAGAAIDVFEVEPVPLDHPFASTPRLVVTPHIAGVTPEAFEATSRMVAEDILRVFGGGEGRYPFPRDGLLL
ncbi:MAG: hydroxyacid dehydrogenase [Planctomycetota bacterium]